MQKYVNNKLTSVTIWQSTHSKPAEAQQPDPQGGVAVIIYLTHTPMETLASEPVAPFGFNDVHVCEDHDSHVWAEPNVAEINAVSLPVNVCLLISLTDSRSSHLTAKSSLGSGPQIDPVTHSAAPMSLPHPEVIQSEASDPIQSTLQVSSGSVCWSVQES